MWFSRRSESGRNVDLAFLSVDVASLNIAAGGGRGNPSFVLPEWLSLFSEGPRSLDVVLTFKVLPLCRENRPHRLFECRFVETSVYRLLRRPDGLRRTLKNHCCPPLSSCQSLPFRNNLGNKSQLETFPC